MTEPYDYQSNIKGKPGSQGTLFQVKDKGLLNPEQRWPRGYTPERQAEVKGALKDTPVEGVYDADAHHQRARVEDTVARSTVPTEHLKNLNKIDADVKQGTAGTYFPIESRLAVNMLDRRKWEGDSSGQTLVHELGHHHANWTAEGVERVRGKSRELAETYGRRDMPSHAPEDAPLTATARAVGFRRVSPGVGEAHADDYMTEHYRTRGRNPESVSEGRYEKIFTPDERQSHYPGYNETRPPQQQSLGPQFHDVPLPGMPEPHKDAARSDATARAVGGL